MYACSLFCHVQLLCQLKCAVPMQMVCCVLLPYAIAVPVAVSAVPVQLVCCVLLPYAIAMPVAVSAVPMQMVRCVLLPCAMMCAMIEVDCYADSVSDLAGLH